MTIMHTGKIVSSIIIRRETAGKGMDLLNLLPALLINGILFLALSAAWAQSGGIRTYVNAPFVQGSNLFMNPLIGDNNTLSNLFRSDAVPNNSSISLWDPASKAFSPASTYNAGTHTWSSNLELLPGTGVLFISPASFTNTIFGYVLNPDGTIYPAPDGKLTPPLPRPEESGIFLLGCKSPMPLNAMDTFLHVIGREARAGEKLTRFDPSSQRYLSYQYLGSGQWDNVPQLQATEAAFYTLSVPEPSTVLIGFAGFAMAGFVRLWQKQMWPFSKRLFVGHWVNCLDQATEAAKHRKPPPATGVKVRLQPGKELLPVKKLDFGFP